MTSEASRFRRLRPSRGLADFVVVANRLPVDQVVLPDGSTTWKRSPGGLVTALEPILRKQRGAWIGWPGVADGDEEPDRPGRPAAASRCGCPPTTSPQYYEGFSERHAVAAVPRRHRQADLPPASGGTATSR